MRHSCAPSVSRNLALLFVALLCFALPIKIVLAAAPIAPTPCDPEYYKSLKSRAWLEAQREITQNQNLIFKPDSVMEYTCFDQFQGVLAREAINMFSETTRWGTILPSNSMDQALQNLVNSAVATWTANNFNHTFLGGRSDTLDYTPTAVTPTNYGPCTNMADVWKEAKCIDFIDEEDYDAFFTFKDYANGKEPRFLPTPCNTGVSSRWNTELQTATVDAQTPWQEDKVKTYFNLMDPANCSSAPKIETGVTVIRGDAPNKFREKICIPPGCHYVPTGLNSGTCETNP